MLKSNNFTFTSISILLGWTVSISSLSPKAQAATLTYSGTTVGAPTWFRPNDDPLNSVSQNIVNYSSFGFTVSAPDNYVFQSTANTANFDNYTFLYKNTFNPTLGNELKNIVIGNDDLSGVYTGFKSGFITALNTNTNYFFVTTGYEAKDFGTFTNTITGVGNITPTTVPEPATILGTIAAFCYGTYTQRKMKLARAIDKKIF